MGGVFCDLQINMNKKYFIFVDETGTNLSDQFFGIGCLIIPTEKIGEYHELLRVKQSQIITRVKERETKLFRELKGQDLINFSKGKRSNPYEMKFKNINENTMEPYQWLISQYFKLDKAKYCCLVIDRDKDNPPEEWCYFDIYLERLHMLLRNNLDDSEFVVLPDEITVPQGKTYEKTLVSKFQKSNKKCFGIHRLESHSSIFLQMVDILTGAVVYGFKESEKLARKSLTNNFTKKVPNYFSVWLYKSKS